jgi:hypothetical protein
MGSLHNKSSGDSNSNSPIGGPGASLSKIGKARLETQAEMMYRRRQRLSTISSDFFDEAAESPRHGMKQRRKSSNFDMLCDPFKYQDYIKKYLDDIEEEDKT